MDLPKQVVKKWEDCCFIHATAGESVRNAAVLNRVAE
jgi:hypothetical protein